MRLINVLLVLFAFNLGIASSAHAEIRVSNANEFLNALDKAKRNETIVVAAGIYQLNETKIGRSLRIVGDGRVVLRARSTTPKGILVPLGGVSLHVENIQLEGARSSDRNGAGIRHEGRDLTLINVSFVNNENGVLSTGHERGVITIENSSFVNNGHGDGFSHGIYVVQAKSLTIRQSEFIGTKIGHHVKSLAEETTITGTRFDEADGRTSYAIDTSKGGALEVTDSVFVQTERADNPSLINYDLTRGGKAVRIVITGNEITNTHPRGLLLRNDSLLTPVMSSNVITNTARGHMRDAELASILDSTPTTPAVQFPDIPPIVARASLSDIDGPILHALADRKSQRAFVLRAPEFAPSSDALALLTLKNNWKSASAPGLFTFGQAFAAGVIEPETPIAVRYGRDTYQAQMNVLATHQDGTVRHAAITVETPSIKTGGKADAALIIARESDDAVRAAGFDWREILEARFDFPMAIRMYDQSGDVDDIHINARALVTDEGSAQELWVDGPLMHEFRINHTLAQNLNLKFDIRVYRNGTIRTSVTFANENSFAPGARDHLYDVAIGDRFHAPHIAHHRASNWRRIFWNGDQPKLHIIQDPVHWTSSASAYNLDPSAGVDAQLIAARAAEVRNAPPLSPASIVQYFPTSGSRADIGPTTQWAAHFANVQTEESKQIMLAQADAAGAVPWHFVDDKTGAPVSILDHPKFWSDERGLEQQYAPDRPHAAIFSASDGGWTPDHAHKPALTAMAYLVTADRYYGDELAMQGAYAIFGRWPEYRANALMAIDVGQVRASAWSLRDISNAAYLLADDHPSKTYLNRVLRDNLANMADKYITRGVMNRAGELEGYLEEHNTREPERITPWENEFFALSLAMAAKRGDANARRLVDWISRFHTGRFNSPDFHLTRATAPAFPAKNTNPAGVVASWQHLAEKMQASDGATPGDFIGYKEFGGGHIASAGTALSAIYSTNHDPRAAEALRRYLLETQDYPLWKPITRGGVRLYSQYQLKISAPNNEQFSRKQLHFNKGRSGNEFVVVSQKSGTVDAGDGNDLIFAPASTVTLRGGRGDDVLSGGGVQIGGPGRDTFASTLSGIDRVIIKDFEPGIDQIKIPENFNDRALMIEKSQSGAVLSHIRAQTRLIVENVTVEQLRENIRLSKN